MSDEMKIITFIVGYLIIGGIGAWLFRYSRGKSRDSNWSTRAACCFLAWPLVTIIGTGYLIVKYSKPVFLCISRKADWIIILASKRELHRDKFGILYTAPSPYGEIKFVKVKDTTGKTYYLTVPRSIDTAREGVAWTYRMNPTDFDPVRA